MYNLEHQSLTIMAMPLILIHHHCCCHHRLYFRCSRWRGGGGCGVGAGAALGPHLVGPAAVPASPAPDAVARSRSSSSEWPTAGGWRRAVHRRGPGPCNRTLGVPEVIVPHRERKNGAHLCPGLFLLLLHLLRRCLLLILTHSSVQMPAMPEQLCLILLLHSTPSPPSRFTCPHWQLP